MTKTLNEKINYFIIDENYEIYKNTLKYNNNYDILEKIDNDIIIDSGEYIIYITKEYSTKIIRKLIFNKNKIYTIENNYPSYATSFDETGEEYDIMRIWHDVCLFSPNKKQL